GAASALLSVTMAAACGLPPVHAATRSTQEQILVSQGLAILASGAGHCPGQWPGILPFPHLRRLRRPDPSHLLPLPDSWPEPALVPRHIRSRVPDATARGDRDRSIGRSGRA